MIPLFSGPTASNTLRTSTNTLTHNTQPYSSQWRAAEQDCISTCFSGKETRELYEQCVQETNSCRYINFMSHHHPRTMSGVISSLKRRVNEIRDPQLRSSEINHLKKAFKANGYPRNVITQTIRRWKPLQESQNQDEQQKPNILYLPYVRNTLEEIERECRKLGVKIVFRSYGTLWQTLMRVKTPVEDLEKTCMRPLAWIVTRAKRRDLKKQIVEH